MFAPAVVESSTPAEIADHVREVEHNLSEYVQDKAKELRIVQIRQEVSHLPSASTGDTACAHARVRLQDGRESDGMGYASAARYKTENVELLATVAMADATVKAIRGVECLAAPAQEVIDVPLQQVSKAAPAPSAPASSAQKKEYKHRFDKKLSAGQLKLLNDMALERGLNPYELAQRHKGKGSNSLSSAEAHELIRGLREGTLK
jgi:alpha-D-ribose 1-methylphosphonate 5-triphosphate synthase subunit PhnG